MSLLITCSLFMMRLSEVFSTRHDLSLRLVLSLTKIFFHFLFLPCKIVIFCSPSNSTNLINSNHLVSARIPPLDFFFHSSFLFDEVPSVMMTTNGNMLACSVFCKKEKKKKTTELLIIKSMAA